MPHYRDERLTGEADHLLPRSEKQVLFDPSVQHQEIQTRQRRRVTRRIHFFGILSLVTVLLIYFNVWRSPSDQFYPIMSTHKTGTFSFDDLSQFSLREEIDNKEHLLLDIRGTITLTSASTSSQDAAVVANISMTTEHIEIDHTNYDTTADSLTIHDPTLKGRSYFRRPTLTLDINVSIKPTTSLTDFNIDTRHLHIEFDPSLDLSVHEKTTLSAIAGHIKSPSKPPIAFNSREKYLRSVSGGIFGSYKLEDLLSCSTTSGGIQVGVFPQKVGKDVLPARFEAKSSSGHIDVQYDMVNVPERDYVVNVHGGSGGISGIYIHGSRTQIMNGSGSKDITIMPFDDKGGELVTECASGTTNLAVRSPLNGANTLGKLKSSHRGVSGGLWLKYPKEWAGVFEGTSISGKIEVEGDGLEDVERGGGPGLKRVSGKSKKAGEAQLGFGTISGGVKLIVE